jgi:hypothetical protein
MIISVKNKNIRKQIYPTSCWISASHYVLQYLDVEVSLPALHTEFYRPDANSYLAMSGAGQPKNILKKYAFDAGYFVDTLKTQSASKSDILTKIASNIRDNIPVIAAIRSAQIRGFGHAVVITAVNPESGTIAFKDPGTGSTPRPFGVDVRTVQYTEFFNGFSYRYHNRMHQNIFAYCTEITYLRPLNEMNWFA